MANDTYEFILPNELPALEKVVQSAAKIALQNFEWRYITFLFYNSSFLYGVDQFLHTYNKSVIVSRGKDVPIFAEDIKQYVMYGRNVLEITHMLDWLQKYQFDNTGRYIVMCESKSKCNETKAVKTFWYHRVTNVIFLKYDVEDNDVNAFMYFYSEENCAMSQPVEINLEECFNDSTHKWFPEKFSNFHKCELITSTFKQLPYMYYEGPNASEMINISGLDGELLLIIVKALNASLKLMTPHRGDGWGAVDPEGKWSGSLADVYFDYANISMTSAALTLTRFTSFQQSYIYNFVVIGWITSPTELEPSSLKLIHPFEKKTHIAVWISFITVVVCCLLVKSTLWRRLKIIEASKNDSLIFYSWMVFMGLPTPQLPKKSFLLHIVFLWIWYTFMIRTMYQASLMNSLKSNFYTSNVDSIKDAIAIGYKFGGGFALRDYYINDPEIFNKFRGMNASEVLKTARKASSGEKYALAVNLEAVNPYYTEHGETYHIMKEKIVISPTAIYFKKFSPLHQSISKILQKLFEAGISDMLYKKYVKDAGKVPKHEASKEAMTIEHFKGCYFILYMGWTFSVFLLLCERLLKFHQKVAR